MDFLRAAAPARIGCSPAGGLYVLCAALTRTVEYCLRLRLAGTCFAGADAAALAGLAAVLGECDGRAQDAGAVRARERVLRNLQRRDRKRHREGHREWHRERASSSPRRGLLAGGSRLLARRRRDGAVGAGAGAILQTGGGADANGGANGHDAFCACFGMGEQALVDLLRVLDPGDNLPIVWECLELTAAAVDRLGAAPAAERLALLEETLEEVCGYKKAFSG